MRIDKARNRETFARAGFLAIWFLAGALLLCILSTLQMIYLDVPFAWRAYFFPFMLGGFSGLVVALWELRLRRYGRRLEESERRFRGLYQNTPVMQHSIDPQGRIINVSNFWLQTMGYRREEVLGRNLTAFMSDKSRRFAEETVFPEFFRAGFVKDIPYQMVKKTGEIIHVLLSAVAEYDEEGNIVRSLAVVIDVTERKQAEREIQKLAYYDTLTGLPNRTLFHDRLGQALAQARREDRKVGVLFLDLDRFKTINDTLGHAAGDILLKYIARRLLGCVRQSDTVARLGGDEFVVILPGVHTERDLTEFSKKILETISKPVRLGEKKFFTTASIGISIYPDDAKAVETLIRNADIAMYAAKDMGKNTFSFFSSDMNEKVVEKMGLETRLREAIKRDEFFLTYQPQMSLATGAMSGMEVLLRWQHPEAGTVSPATFIRVAEETGLIIPIGEWVLHTACAQAMLWHKAGLPRLRMGVNISSRQFNQPDFIDMVDRVLQQTGYDPKYLELELTEGIVMENVPETIMTLTDLKVRGIHLAIDDFGTGYSSLSYLKHFPFDRLKIAQEFVRDISIDPEDAAIVEAITAMASSLGLQVIAEGVERKEQLDFLREHRCHEMQGYYFAHPLKVAEMTGMLKVGLPQKESILH
jgi:diguanylate cyclase (GGDEF)-like protein/PAS domain S-box-containing protein